MKSWKRILSVTIVIIYFYIFMEWLFFATKPSFLSTLKPSELISILWVSPVPIALFIAWLFAGLWAADFFCQKFLQRRLFVSLANVIPAFLAACCVLVLVDNFTYTLFHFGVKSTQGILQWIWRVGFLALFVFIYRALYREERGESLQKHRPKYLILSCGLVLVSLIFILFQGITAGETARSFEGNPSLSGKRPNILLIGSDGLNANHMSAYGYERDTTPFIRESMNEAFVFENAFPNAGNTGSSVASFLSSKLPTTTKLMYPPDILKGKDAFQHLPGILKKLGYRTADISVRHFADAYDLNLRNGFDYANFREVKDIDNGFIPLWFKDKFINESYFLEQILERLEIRLLHVFGIKKMVDPYEEVIGGKKRWYPDHERISELFRLIDASQTPFFIHIHLLCTHGGTFRPTGQFFSSGQKQKNVWMADFYDDAILSFDEYFLSVINHLEADKKLDKTLIVLHSDHGFKFSTEERIPLMFYFPGHSHAGKVSVNVENLDIAPTLLDYLGIEKPEWMEGKSLLSENPNRLQPIFATQSGKEAHKRRKAWDVKADLNHPFSGITHMTMVICSRVYKLNLKTGKIIANKVKDHTAPCDSSQMPNKRTAKKLILNHLKQKGYDITLIPK